MIIPNQEKPMPPIPPELPSAVPNRKERLSRPSNRAPSIAPPPYSAHAPQPAVDLLESSSPSSPRSPTVPQNLPRQNRLKVHREDNWGIKETYLLDPSLPTPPGAPEENLSLYASNGHVFAEVYVVGEDVKGKVSMDFRSKKGSVYVTIPACPPTVPLQITASTNRHGNIFMKLPPKFNGPLVIEAKHGWGPRLEPSLKAVARVFEETGNVRRYWIGEWNGETEWTGDECLIHTYDGHIWPPVVFLPAIIAVHPIHSSKLANMIITDENKYRPGDTLQPADLPGPSGSTSTSGTSVASVASVDEFERFEPPPYSPQRDARVDLLEGEDAIVSPTAQAVSISPFPTSPRSPFPTTISRIPPELPRQNRLRVFRDNSGIRDTYVIDPTLPAPPGSHDKALSVYSQNGSIDALVYLTQSVGRTAKGRVELEGLSMNGSVKFSVAECPADMRLSILVESRNGSIALFLPPTFRGPLTITHENGVSTIAPSLRSRTRTLDETHALHRCWVGEWGEDDDPNWVADECVVGSHNGSVKVGYWSAEEAGKQQLIPKGIMEKVFGEKKN
ncbi:hypothetical protein CALVIDRAFT_599572 [Calocera viscosa TUFC12733]|uniref:DUF7330 domain-containing protein n=1 Tax=Calocera viscosa (strain TUFC12733) TaxID=1330018 RepID=A0A167KN72_CALVF|nr:hypothetical protein CALVIDRAFT_599572 [Calocera viscosa TUFC12733]